MEEAAARAATIAHVARDAGVSIPTVSRVINASAPVAAETRARVLASIDRLGYHPNPMARGLSLGRSGTVLVVLPHIAEPSVAVRLGGLVKVLRRTPFDLHLVDVERPESERPPLFQLVAQTHPAGAVIMSLPPSPDDAARFASSNVPVVVVDVAGSDFPGDAIDDTEGGAMATRHLLSLGHRKIAFVGDEESSTIGVPASAHRRLGYETALRAAGVAVRDDYIRRAPSDTAAASERAEELLAAGDPPTAIFAAYDVMAFGVLSAARRLGLRVPEDLSVVGFDDISAAELVRLTTVRQPLELSGVRAGLRLMELLGHPMDEAMPDFPPLELVVRGTTAPPPAGSRSQGPGTVPQTRAPGEEAEVSTTFGRAPRRGQRIPRRK